MPVQRAMSGSRATLAAAADIEAFCTLATNASHCSPYSRGVASRLTRLAANITPALSPAIPTAAAPTVVRTGTAVRPAPRCSASLPPSATVTGLASRAAAGAARRRRAAAAGTGTAPGPGEPPSPPGRHAWPATPRSSRWRR